MFAARLAGDDPGTGQYLRTGDLGFMAKGQLFVTGRLKDLIILQGRNLYPHDIELTAQMAHSALKPGGCVAFSSEIERGRKTDCPSRGHPAIAGPPAAFCRQFEQPVLEEYGVPVHTIALVPPKTIPKTSSGKLQRSACRKSFVSGELTVLTISLLEHQAVSPAECMLRPARNWSSIWRKSGGARLLWKG